MVGIVDDNGTRAIGYGKPSLDSDQTVDGDTVFEIGSVTKVFTATLLAEMAERGEVSLDDPISKYLPKSVKTPTRNGKEITLLALATHTSGFPKMPTNWAPRDNRNPYADYTLEQMYAFLSGYTLTRDIGSQFEYSNYGGALLGHILALRAGTDYETLVQTRILKPLTMKSTGVRLTPDMATHLAQGYYSGLRPATNWDLPTFTGAGGLRSTANDMMKFVAANLGLIKSPLLAAMQMTHQPRHNTDLSNAQIGLCWVILRQFDTEIVCHNGQTGGYHAFVGFDKSKRKGVVVLSNSANNIDDIGLHLLESQYPIAKPNPPEEHKAIKLDAKIFDVYVGEYQLATNFIFKVSREGERFYVQGTGQQRGEVFAETESDFFAEEVEATMTFVKGDKGQVTELVLHQNGDHKAKKIK